MPGFRRASLLAFLFAFTCGEQQTIADEAAWRARLNDEAPQQWEQLLDATENLAIHATFVQVDLDSGQQLAQEDTEIVVAGWNAIVKDKRGEGKSDHHVVENQQYRFEVEKRSADWLITDLVNYPHASRTRQEQREALFAGRVTIDGSTARGQALKAACRGLILYNTWFSQMVSDNAFKLERVAEVEQGLRVEFAYQPQRRGNDAAGSGFVVLDPRRHWQIVEGTIAGQWGTEPASAEVGTMKIKNEFNDQQPARVRRQSLRIDARTPDAKSISTELIWTYDFEPAQSVDPHAFTTAAYGLADPEQDKPRTWLMPILTGTIFLFLLAWFIANHLRARRLPAV